MNIVHCETVDQLKKVIFCLFFDEGHHMYVAGNLSYEDIRDFPGIYDDELVKSVNYTDQWWCEMDALCVDDLREAVEDGIPDCVKNFTPGTLVWMISDDYDRFGSVRFRVFNYFPDSESSFKSFIMGVPSSPVV